MVDPVILQALRRGLKHLGLRNLDVGLRKERRAGFRGEAEEQTAGGKFRVVAGSQEIP